MKTLLNNIITYYQNHRLLTFFVLFVVAVIVVSVTTPEESSELNSWQGIQIGQRVSSEDLNTLDPISVVQDGDKTTYTYQSEFKSFPNEVVVNNNQTAIFIKEYLVADETHVLGFYTRQLGEPDLLLEVPEIAHSVRAAVFLDEGLVVIHDYTAQIKKVIQKWYFEPMSETEFLSSWGSSLEIEEEIEQPHPPLLETPN